MAERPDFIKCIRLKFNGCDIPLHGIKFPGGEVHVRVQPPRPIVSGTVKTVLLSARIESMDALFGLDLALDAARRLIREGELAVSYGARYILECPYFPGARQDRVAVPGDALAAARFAAFINAMKFDEVEVWDCHSPTSLALLDNVRHVTAAEFCEDIPNIVDDTVVVAPDKGGVERARAAAERLGARLVLADKKRDPATGDLMPGAEVYCEDLGEADVLVVDDICDGGWTFTNLAAALRPRTSGRLMLYVTHGIFSKGFAALAENYDAVYCANLFRPERADLIAAPRGTPFLHVLANH
jgi:ribose-phosphate pyrophosphokinase